MSVTAAGSLPGGASSTQSYVYKRAGLTVRLGLEEVASDLYKVKPAVYSAPDASAVVVFSGCLTNLAELSRRNGGGPGGPRGGSASPSRFGGDLNNSTLERKSSIERSLDIGVSTARLVLELYQQQAAQREGDEVIMLSELQGEFAFVIYDNKRKQAFAARDPSGDEPLYFHISDEGDVSFAGSRLAIPDGEQPHEWRELPPGHFISGKAPKLHQFALTPQQLAMREIEQSDELLDASHSSGGMMGSGLARRRSLALEGEDDLLSHPTTSACHRRTSLDNDSLIKRKSLGLEGDVFSLDL